MQKDVLTVCNLTSLSENVLSEMFRSGVDRHIVGRLIEYLKRRTHFRLLISVTKV